MDVWDRMDVREATTEFNVKSSVIVYIFPQAYVTEFLQEPNLLQMCFPFSENLQYKMTQQPGKGRGKENLPCHFSFFYKTVVIDDHLFCLFKQTNRDAKGKI